MRKSLIPVILAGGKGERFWPLSRRDRPKQFLCLDGSGKSLLQSTADRLLDMAGGWANLWVVTAGDLAQGVREQLPELPPENLLVEPLGRDTAPAITWTTLEISQRYGKDAMVGFFPADHWIGNQAAYQQTLEAALTMAEAQQAIATLGITPSYPSTGYGYIEQGDSLGQYGDLTAYKVTRFTEKPNSTTAAEFIATGKFSWNSGMFIFPAGVVLAELAIHAPEILTPLQTQGISCYPHLPKKSIDYALMEKTNLAYVFPADFGWDDLGDWNALARLLQGEQANLDLAQHIALDTTGGIFYTSNQQEVIATIGLEDIVVVRDGNVTLIVKKDRTQDIKQLLEKVRQHPAADELL
jgi:mannose-1-phosphate guanylyltransferase